MKEITEENSPRMPMIPMREEIKRSKFGKGGLIEGGRGKEFISEVEGSNLVTLSRVGAHGIMERIYTINTKDGPLVENDAKLVRVGSKEYLELNKILSNYERNFRK